MDLLKKGQKLSIFIQKPDSIVEMSCVLVELYSDRMMIDLPPYFMRYIEYLDVGCPLTVKVFSKLGTVDFNTIVITSPLEDNFEVELDYNAICLTPGEQMPVINASLPVNLFFNDSTINVTTFEIATEYMKIYSNYEFQVGNTMDGELVLPKNYGIIEFKAAITHIDPVYEDEFTISYNGMNEENRQNLLYYMYLYANNSD